MTDGLKPYPAYKDSGVPWLGKVPAHWQQLPGRACFIEKKAPNIGMQETTVLSLSYGQIVVKPPEKLHGLVPASFETYQIIEPYDIVIRPTDLQNDWVSLRTGLARTRGIITSAYMRLRTKALLVPEYGRLLLHTYDLNKVFYGLGSGLRQNLSWRDFKYLPCLVPPLEEQAAITRFLAHHDRLTRRYIRAQRRLIELLTEQKQAIIQRAVTRGLDPDVPLKPSGVEWLGDVPEHWKIKRLKALVTESVAGPYGSSLTKSMYTSAGFRVYGQQQVIPDNFSTGDYYISEEKYQEMQQYRVFAGDVLVSVMGTVGRVAVVPESAEPGIINPRLVRYRPNLEKVRPRYLQLALLSPAAQSQLSGRAKGTTMEGLNMQILGCLVLAIPSLDEQDAILLEVGTETKQLQKAINAMSRNLSLIREYRTRLIADVVTGKLDVRGVAPEALLPDLDEAGELGELDDLEDNAELDTSDAEELDDADD